MIGLSSQEPLNTDTPRTTQMQLNCDGCHPLHALTHFNPRIKHFLVHLMVLAVHSRVQTIL